MIPKNSKRFAVETVSTFFEVHIVHAENEEQAKSIAQNADYNASKWLGSQVVTVFEPSDVDMNRYRTLDSYFFEGSACVDEDGYLYYVKQNGEFNGNMPKTKIFVSVKEDSDPPED